MPWKARRREYERSDRVYKQTSEFRALRNSIVDFAPGLLMQSGREKIKGIQLPTEYPADKNVQFCFFRMFKEEIPASRRIFAKKFDLSDQLTAVNLFISLRQLMNRLTARLKYTEGYLRPIEETYNNHQQRGVIT